MKRREFLLAGAAASLAAAWPLPAAAREPPLVAFLTYADEKTVAPYLASFREAMRSRGHVEGQNVRIESYSANFSREEADRLASQLVARNPTVIVAQGGTIPRLVKQTRTVPILTVYSGDLVEAGLIRSLAHPGANVTGMQVLRADIVGKRMEFLKEVAPHLKRIAVLADPRHPGETGERAKTLAAAEQLGVHMDFYAVTSPQELQDAMERARQSGAGGLVVFPDNITFSNRFKIAEYAIKHRLPAVSGWDAYADAGFLLMWGPSLRAMYARLAYFADRILKGEKPADLPAEMPSVMELMVNLKTAREIGINIPQSILLRADKVLE